MFLWEFQISSLHPFSPHFPLFSLPLLLSPLITFPQTDCRMKWLLWCGSYQTPFHRWKEKQKALDLIKLCAGIVVVCWNCSLCSSLHSCVTPPAPWLSRPAIVLGGCRQPCWEWVWFQSWLSTPRLSLGGAVCGPLLMFSIALQNIKGIGQIKRGTAHCSIW